MVIPRPLVVTTVFPRVESVSEQCPKNISEKNVVFFGRPEIQKSYEILNLPRQSSFTDETHCRHLTRPARDLTRPDQGQHCTDR